MKRIFWLIVLIVLIPSLAAAQGFGGGFSGGPSSPPASESVAGISELCTDAEYTAGTKTDCAGTPANAKVELDKKQATIAAGTYAAYDKTIPFAAGGGTVDAITADYTPNVTLADGVTVAFRSAGANTSTTPSFAPDGLTARTIVKAGGAALVAGDIGAAGFVGILQYNLANTRWELLNPVKPQGTLTADNVTNSNIPAKDNAGEMENLTLDGHLSLTGTSSPALAVITVEVDGHTDATVLTAASMTGPGAVVYNTGQGAADVFLYFPTAAAGLSALFPVGTTQAGNHWGVCTNAAVTDKIYLVAADGTVTAGDDDGCVWMVAATIGQAFACWSFKTDAYDWACKSIATAGSTFVAGADH